MVSRRLFGLFVLVLPACSAVLGLKDLTPVEGDGGADAPDAAFDGGGSTPDASLDGGCGDLRTSADHCGRCGHSCLGGECHDGGCMPVALATGQGTVGGVALDGDDVYFTSLSGNLVARVSKDGGAVVGYASSPAVKDARRIAVDATHVYWTSSELLAGAVSRCPLAGCGAGPEVLATPEEPTGLALDQKGVTWADRNGQRIARWTLPAGPTTVLSVPTVLPVTVAVEGDDVFWVGDFSGEVFRRNPADGGSVLLGANGQSGRVITADAQNVYWGAAQDYGQPGNISRVPRGGGAIGLVARAGGDPMGITVDGDRIYWTSWERLPDGAYVSGAVRSCPLAGSCASTLLVAADQPRGIAVDARAIYFGTDGAVMRLAKP